MANKIYPDEMEKLRFRCRKELVVPYWPIALNVALDSIEVVVGPTLHVDESLESIERLLRCRCHPNCRIKVRKSDVPYRQW